MGGEALPEQQVNTFSVMPLFQWQCVSVQRELICYLLGTLPVTPLCSRRLCSVASETETNVTSVLRNQNRKLTQIAIYGLYGVWSNVFKLKIQRYGADFYFQIGLIPAFYTLKTLYIIPHCWHSTRKCFASSLLKTCIIVAMKSVISFIGLSLV